MRPKKFWDQICFWPEFFSDQIFSDPNFFTPKLFLEPNFFRHKFFSDPNFFQTQIFFGTPNVLQHKFLQPSETHIFSRPKFFQDSKIFRTKFLCFIIFWDLNFLEPKVFESWIFFYNHKSFRNQNLSGPFQYSNLIR